jgi:hypothetical protein
MSIKKKSLSLNIKSKKNRNWEQDVLPFVKEELEKFAEKGIVPTLRTIFYILASRKILQYVQNDYAYLSGYTAKCRKRSVTLNRLNIEGVKRDGLMEEIREILSSQQLLIGYVRKRHITRGSSNDIILYDEVEKNKKYVLRTNEVLPIDCFSDETRGTYKDFNDEYFTPEEHIKETLDFLRYLPSQYKKMIPKWHTQPYYVELWTEKNAMVGTFRSILEGQDVRIVYNRGFDSMSNVWRTYQRIKKAWSQNKKVRILYCGDLDPSGDAMDDIINENMKVCFNVQEFKWRGDYDFKRVGVLYEHIEKFKLPKNPDPKVLAKLKEDPRKERFKQKYGLQSDGDLFQVEIDALAAFAPLEFKNMILDEINSYYNNEIYENLLSDAKYSEDQISIHVRKNVQIFLEEHNVKLMWKWLETSA